MHKVFTILFELYISTLKPLQGCLWMCIYSILQWNKENRFAMENKYPALDFIEYQKMLILIHPIAIYSFLFI